MDISIWEIIFSAGGLGRAFVNLSFVSGAIATLGFFLSLNHEDENSRAWVRLAKTAFILHAVSVMGIIITLFSMIYFHMYEYHYVWSHSSNELPVHFMISCFWEGQEGSFLLWTFWHVVLGLVIFFRGGFWRNGVLAVLSSVQVMLCSMLLGIWIPELSVQFFLSIFLLAMTGGMYLSGAFTSHKNLMYAAIVWVLIVLTAIWKDWSGVGSGVKQKLIRLAQGEISVENWISLFWLICGILLLILLIQELLRWNKTQASGWPVVFFTAIWMCGMVLFLVPVVGWSVGSSPFLLLREAMPDQAVFVTNPDFVPTNGNGLNPLLQNYWMVIHPPTLFLGFATTLIPFAFMITGLMTGKTTEWIRPATPWNLLTALVLGTGILMGGYWAYETLSFGGYWNWDPVENSSLVPWLTCIGSLHTFVAWNQKRSQLRYAYLLVILTFLLVLYSTFLTRSGILGEASVHSFTDLGLSGQLLVLLAVYFTGMLLIWLRRGHMLPVAEKETAVWSREFFLFLAASVLLFSAFEIIFFTSSPVLNKIFGLSIAPKNALFYYKWNVWFSMAIAVLSGLGQFFFWNKIEKETLLKALYRPFALAVFSTLAILITLMMYEWKFVYNETFRNELQDIREISGDLYYYTQVIRYAFFFVADELMLITSLFTVFANLDILIQLVRKKAGNIKLIGGSLAHLGFGLMLAGILFSSGYDSIVSVNFKPGELGNMFPDDARNDNVLLLKNEPKYVKGYKLTYLGKKQALAPLESFTVLEWDDFSLKGKFTDAAGDEFSVMLPVDIFYKDSLSKKADTRFDQEKLRAFTEKNLGLLKPEHLNNRSLYGVEFESMVDTSYRFVLYPEAELNKSMGILAHPDRKIAVDKDLYVHVSSIPDPEASKEEVQEFELRLAKGDTAQTGSCMVILDNLVQVRDIPELAQYDFVAKAKIRVLKNGKEFLAEPIYIIDDRQPVSLSAFVQEAGIGFTFSGVDVDAGKIVLKAEELTEPEDWVVLKAISKPWINLLWLGTFILTAGFGIAIWRRFSLSKAE